MEMGWVGDGVLGGAAVPHAALTLTQLGGVALETQAELRLLLQMHPLQADGRARRGRLLLGLSASGGSRGWRPLVATGCTAGGVAAGRSTCHGQEQMSQKMRSLCFGM